LRLELRRGAAGNSEAVYSATGEAGRLERNRHYVPGAIPLHPIRTAPPRCRFATGRNRWSPSRFRWIGTCLSVRCSVHIGSRTAQD
jgi:hypothetical protein